MMAGMSMVDGGPGLPVFAESVFHYIAKGIPQVGEVEDVPDPVVRKNLSQVGRWRSTRFWRCQFMFSVPALINKNCRRPS